MNRPVNRKIIEREALTQTVGELRAAGKTIVQCHGCFDIVHPGHIRYLESARQLADVLIVSLTGDALMEKGPDRPFIPQALRAENLAALEFVDWVVIDPHPTACEILELIKPDVYVKGREYARSSDPRFLREREIVQRHGGRVVFSSGDVVFSSTRLLESIDRDHQLDAHRLRTFCRRAGITDAGLCETLDAFAGLNVVVVGDCFREHYEFCDPIEVGGDAPVVSLQRLGGARYWGGAVATALQLRALGARVHLLSSIGDDDASHELRRAIGEHGVRASLLRSRSSLPVRTTFLADETKLFKLTDGESAPLDSSAEKDAVAALLELIERADLLIWCDHGLGMLTPGLLGGVAERVRERGLTVAAGAPAQRSQLLTFKDPDLLLVSERRLREALHDMTCGLSAAAWSLLDHTHGRSVLVSLHKRGLICFDRQDPDPDSAGWSDRLRSEFVPAFTDRFVDSQGGEDCMLAVAALATTLKRPLQWAAYLAAAAQSIVVTRVGRHTVSAEQLRSWIIQRPELLPEGCFIPEPARASGFLPDGSPDGSPDGTAWGVGVHKSLDDERHAADTPVAGSPGV